MINALTIICAVLTVLVIFRGYRRGIIGIVYGVAAWLFICIFVIVVSPVLYNTLEENESFCDMIYEKIYPYVDSSIPKLQSRAINSTGSPDEKYMNMAQNASISVPEEYQDAFNNYIENGGDISDVSDAVNQYLDDTGKDLGDVARDIQDGNIQVPEQYQGLVDGIKDSGVDLSELADSVKDSGVNLSDIAESLKEGVSGTAKDVRENAVAAAAKKVTDLILHILAVIMAYIIAKIICLIVKLVISFITETGPIKPVVHMAGAALGIIEALLYIWIILYIISLVRLAPQGQGWYDQVQANPILTFLYDNNLLGSFLSGLMG